MTPKRKAKELVIKYQEEISIILARKCALIAVDEIISQFTNKCCESANSRYWGEVKEEINKL